VVVVSDGREHYEEPVRLPAGHGLVNLEIGDSQSYLSREHHAAGASKLPSIGHCATKIVLFLLLLLSKHPYLQRNKILLY
jgi:hypothetical protein